MRLCDLPWRQVSSTSRGVELAAWVPLAKGRGVEIFDTDDGYTVDHHKGCYRTTPFERLLDDGPALMAQCILNKLLQE